MFRASIAIAALLLSAAPALAQQAKGTSTPQLRGVSVQGVSKTGVSARGIKGVSRGNQGAGFSYSRTQVSEVGAPPQTVAIPPSLTGTARMKAEYLTPNPADASKPFVVETESVRLPLANEKQVYWVPNDRTDVVRR